MAQDGETLVAARESRPVGAPSAFRGPEPPREEDIYRCVHCGLCLSACPTYTVLGLETESPRGRIALVRAAHEGRVALTPGVIAHWDLCLQCRACEAVCPSAVPYGRMMERVRAEVVRQRSSSPLARLLRRLAYVEFLPHPGRLLLAGRLLRLYQRWGLQAAMRRLGIPSLFPGLAAADASLPRLPDHFFEASGQGYSAVGQKRCRVALLSGCVMPMFYASTMEATARVLARNGCEVVVPQGQVCCGALNLHGGEREKAREMARRNIDVFLAAGADFVVTNSAGCGAAMKEYGELLHDDPAYAEKAQKFARMVRDVHEFLVALPLNPPKHELPLSVTYQDSCHLAHAQRVTAAPRALLRSIPGLRLMEMSRPDLCCGAAGSYQMLQREMSRQLLDRKMADAAATGAQVIATANPGCVMQLELGVRRAGLKAAVRYVIDLLDEAYGD